MLKRPTSGSPEGSTLGGGTATQRIAATKRPQRSAFCSCCGAWRGVLGLEPDPALFVRNLALVFAEVRRVLRRDGLLWLNLGDSYVGGNRGAWSGDRGRASSKQRPNAGSLVSESPNRLVTDASWRRDREVLARMPHKSGSGLKAKDMVGAPWRVALGLQGFAVLPGADLADAAEDLREARESRDWQLVEAVEGSLRAWSAASSFLGPWWVRSDVIWYKPSALPESVRDRPTKAHEYIFMLAKSERYFYDAEAGKEPLSPSSIARLRQTTFWSQKGGPKDYGTAGVSDHRSARKALEGLARRFDDGAARMQRNRDRLRALGGDHDNPWRTPAPAEPPGPTLPGFDPPVQLEPAAYSSGQTDRNFRDNHGGIPDHLGRAGFPWEDDGSGRNRRTVWEITSRPSGEDHFAAFPPELVEPCILASTSERGVCPECGAPWERIQETRTRIVPSLLRANLEGPQQGEIIVVGGRLLGWRPTCRHYDHLYRAEFQRARDPRRRARQEAVDHLSAKRRKGLGGGWWERARARPGRSSWAALPGIVLDPFVGSGSAGIAARRLFRRFIGIDLNPQYAEMARRRIAEDAPLFNRAGDLTPPLA